MILTQRDVRGLGKHSSRRGSALLVSMMFVVIVAGMGVCMIQMHTGQSRRKEQALDNKLALYIAEAGLSEAFMAVAIGKSGDVGSSTVPASFGNGLYWVEAAEQGDGQVALVSTGLCGNGRFSVSAVLQRQVDKIASLGIYAATGVVVGERCLIDGYSSSKGTYASQVNANLGNGTTGKGAALSSGEGIVLEGSAAGGGVLGAVGGVLGGSPSNGTIVYGNASPGPNDTVTLGSDVTVTGSTTPASATVTLPEINVPSLPSRGAFTVGTNRTLSGAEYSLTSLNVNTGVTLTLQGPTSLVLGQLNLATGATLNIDGTGGQVEVYVTQRLGVKSGSVISTVGDDPTTFVMMITADNWLDFNRDGIADNPIEFLPTGDVFGYIYAPTVDFELQSATHLYGGIVSNSLTLGDDVRLTFDIALVTTEITAAGLPLLVAWQVCDLPEAPIMTRTRDPHQTLADAGITPVPSASASPDAWVSIKYFDAAGDVQTYVGRESMFNWSLVRQLVGIVWDDDAVPGDEGRVLQVPKALSNTAVTVQRETSGKRGSGLLDLLGL